jgi:NADH-quinone oxidoreductase subunit A
VLLIPFFLFACLSFIVCAVVGLLVYVTTPKLPYFEKVSAYECGFEPFGDARSPFEVHYYRVAIMFMIFDIEVGFLFPWAVTAGSLGEVGYWVVMTFLAILAAGFQYEDQEGILNWK